jgi:protein-disulfide isomerase
MQEVTMQASQQPLRHNGEPRISSWQTWCDLALGLAILIVTSAALWTALRNGLVGGRTASMGAIELPTRAISIAGAIVNGKGSAKVAVIEYFDFQCPYCRVFARTTLPLVQRKYVDSGDVVFVFRQLPLKGHQFAFRAAEAAQCAAEQGRFVEMYDALFTNPDRLSEDDLLDHAKGLGLGGDSFQACMAGTAAAHVEADAAGAALLGIHETPVFLVGRVQSDRTVRVVNSIVGAKSFSEFQGVLDGALASEPGGRGHR